MIPDQYTSSFDKKTELWIKSTLSNDESSSDQEMIEYFMQEGLSGKDAKLWTSRRSFYMNNIVETI